MSGWVTTKKRGRDDTLIEQDRQKAIVARRRQQKQPIRQRKKNAMSLTSGTRPKAKRRGGALEDDDEDSLNDFVVNDDDEEALQTDYSEEEDESENGLILVDDDADDHKKSKLPLTHPLKAAGSGSDPSVEKDNNLHLLDISPDTDDDSDADFLFGNLKPRTSRPPPAMRKKPQPPTKSQPRGRASDKRIRTTKKSLLPSSSDDDDDYDTLVTKTEKRSNGIIELLDTDDDEFVQPTPKASRFFQPSKSNKRVTAGSASATSKRKLMTTTPTTSVYQVDPRAANRPTKTNDAGGKPDGKEMPRATIDAIKRSKYMDDYELYTSMEDDDEAVMEQSKRELAVAAKTTTTLPQSAAASPTRGVQDNTLIDTPPPQPMKKQAVAAAEEDEIDSGGKPGRKKPRVTVDAIQRFNMDDEYSSMDEDEAVALAWAMEQSEKVLARSTTTLPKSMSTPTRGVHDNALVDTPQPVKQAIAFAEDDEIDVDEIEDDEEEDDVYVDDAKTAGLVLETANTLSSHVLQRMIRWSQHHTGSGLDDNSTIPQGIIVDGALALHTITTTSGADTPDPSWISQELMQQHICPQLKLADYQLIGVNWLALLHGMKCEIKGKKFTNVNGILADEMGLGKTIQTIAFLAWLKYNATNEGRQLGVLQPNIHEDSRDNDHRHVVSLVASDDDDDNDDEVEVKISGAHRPHIIICPASVLSNWEREFETFCPVLNVVKYHGSMEERKEIKSKLRQYLPGRKQKSNKPLDIILCPITYFSAEKPDDRSFLRQFRFEYMVIDEAHVLKDPKGKRYKNLDAFRTNHRLLLTGTPVQNSPQELMALLCFLMPLFSRSDVHNSSDNERNDGGLGMLQHFVTLQRDSKSQAEADRAAYKKLKQLFAPFVLRRKKDDVLQQMLPEKECKVEMVELDPKSRAFYHSICANHVDNLRRNNGALSVATRKHLFVELRKAANHPLLLRRRHKTPPEIEHLANTLKKFGQFTGDACNMEKIKDELENYSDFKIHLVASHLIEENPCRRKELSQYILNEDALYASAKFVRLRILLLELVSDGHRILIFSQWTSCMNLLACLVESLGLQFLRMDGSTQTSTRQGLIDRFNQDSSIPVFLLSTRACGLGINLTAADTCIIHDVDFNPFNDLQAEDRCHRIGQTKKVTVIKLVAKDTVDEDIYARQQQKAQMNAAIMENGTKMTGKSKSSRSDDPKDEANVLQSALNRFMQSASANAVKDDDRSTATVEITI